MTMGNNAGEIRGRLVLDKSGWTGPLQSGVAEARQAGAQIGAGLNDAGKAGGGAGKAIGGGMRDAAQAIGTTTAELEALISRAGRANSIVGGVVGGLVTSASTAAIGMLREAASGVASFVAESVQLAAQNEQTAISFEVLTGSAETAKSLMEEIRKFAETTPYGSSEIASAGKQLLAFGIEAKEVVPTLRRLGDIASGLNIPLEDMAQLFGKIRTENKLTGESLMQFNQRGIPLMDELAKSLGKGKDEIQKMVSAGEIGFADVERAIAGMTSEGGKFAGMMDRQSQSAMGLWSTLQDTIEGLKRSLGEGLIQDDGGKQILKDLIAEAEKLKPIFEDAGKALAAALAAAMPHIKSLLETATAILNIASGQIEKEKLKNATPNQIDDAVSQVGKSGSASDATRIGEAVFGSARAAASGFGGIRNAVGDAMPAEASKEFTVLEARLAERAVLRQQLDALAAAIQAGGDVDRSLIQAVTATASKVSTAVTDSQGMLSILKADSGGYFNRKQSFREGLSDAGTSPDDRLQFKGSAKNKSIQQIATDAGLLASRQLDAVKSVLTEASFRRTSDVKDKVSTEAKQTADAKRDRDAAGAIAKTNAAGETLQREVEKSLTERNAKLLKLQREFEIASLKAQGDAAGVRRAQMRQEHEADLAQAKTDDEKKLQQQIYAAKQAELEADIAADQAKLADRADRLAERGAQGITAGASRSRRRPIESTAGMGETPDVGSPGQAARPRRWADREIDRLTARDQKFGHLSKLEQSRLARLKGASGQGDESPMAGARQAVNRFAQSATANSGSAGGVPTAGPGPGMPSAGPVINVSAPMPTAEQIGKAIAAEVIPVVATMLRNSQAGAKAAAFANAAKAGT